MSSAMLLAPSARASANFQSIAIGGRRRLELRCLGFFGLDAGDNGIENGRLRLFDRRAGEVDRESCLPLQPLGMIFGPLHALIMLELSNLCVPGVHIRGDFRLQRIPVRNHFIVGGLDVPDPFFGLRP